ncbi:MAG: PIN domain-containing protein [Thermaerobacter sp.]|nr:PIN domain-containing protein [Thermaerobacter sp.]
MTSYLLDSTAVIDWLRGRGAVVAWLADAVAGGALLMVTSITVAEVLAGLEPKDRDRVAPLLADFGWAELTRTASMHAASLFWQHERSGRRLPLPDLLQASAALEAGAILATSNLRHFPDVRSVDPRRYVRGTMLVPGGVPDPAQNSTPSDGGHTH